MVEKLVLATAITFALNIFIGISSSSATSKNQAQSINSSSQATSLVSLSGLQKNWQ